MKHSIAYGNSHFEEISDYVINNQIQNSEEINITAVPNENEPTEDDTDEDTKDILPTCDMALSFLKNKKGSNKQLHFKEKNGSDNCNSASLSRKKQSSDDDINKQKGLCMNASSNASSDSSDQNALKKLNIGEIGDHDEKSLKVKSGTLSDKQQQIQENNYQKKRFNQKKEDSKRTQAMKPVEVNPYIRKNTSSNENISIKTGFPPYKKEIKHPNILQSDRSESKYYNQPQSHTQQYERYSYPPDYGHPQKQQQHSSYNYYQNHYNSNQNT